MKRRRRSQRKEEKARKVVLDLEAAEEVVRLIDDVPGVADEDALDEALEAFDQAGTRVPPEGQELAARGEAVAFEVTPEAVTAVETLIDRNVATEPGLLKRTGSRIRTKLRQARRKADRID